jgi:NAD(P)-dependent dehydrogenase (short-subunit alcohol dehydrogenase family)
MILVTGAAGVLGQAVVKRLSKDGVAVAAVDFQATIPPVGQTLSIGGVDLADCDACSKMMQVLETAGINALHGLVNVAGGFVWEKIANGSWQSWERMYRINVQSAHHAIVHALPMLRVGHGAIVNIGAASAARADGGMGAYTASKSAVARLTESLAAEETMYGVRVNAILPSIIDTPKNRADIPDGDFSKWVSPAEIAEVVAFLISQSASGVTGASIPVFGRVV